jgi:hypothetical protein
MSFMALWFGGFTGTAFLQGVWLGMCLTPPLVWTLPVTAPSPTVGPPAVPQGQVARTQGTN